MTTLTTVSGIRARIFEQPDRPPFMIAVDLANVYGTSPSNLRRAVRRNADRFPPDFMFMLSEVEETERLSQNGTTSQGRRTDMDTMVFTHAGAYALSAVLKTPIAAQVSVVIHRAFAAMEQDEKAELRHLLRRLRSEARGRRPIRSKVVDGVREGWSFDQLWRDGSYSRLKVTQAIHDCLELGLIQSVPAGTDFALLAKLSDAAEDDARQIEMFGDV